MLTLRVTSSRNCPGSTKKLPRPVLLFQCIDCGHVDMAEWPEPEGE